MVGNVLVLARSGVRSITSTPPLLHGRHCSGLKNSRRLLSEKLQKMCGQKQKNMWSKLKKNTAKKTMRVKV